jgi:hypothetical protein
MNHKEIERWHQAKDLKRASQVLVVVAVVLSLRIYGFPLREDE